MRDLPSDVYLRHALLTWAMAWFGGSPALVRNCLAAIYATRAERKP